jgi:hypothetical protein
MYKLLAADEGLSDFLSKNNPLDPKFKDVASVVNAILTIVYPIGGIILFFIIAWGGFDFMTSQGNAEKIKSAKAKITSGIIGYALLALSYIVVKVIANILALNNGVIN